MNRHQTEANQLLDDLLVVELGDEATQYCGQLLAELGARVIKVEPPGGAGARHRGPWKDDQPDVNGSLYFWAFNTSKESITLDLNNEIDRRTLRQLIGQADILLEDFLPGLLDSKGLGYAQLSRLNSGLIMTSITPFGQSGPRARWKGTDMIYWATGGLLAGAGYGDEGSPPLQSHGDLSYLVGGHSGFVGSLIALTGRDLTGEGQHVDASIHEACSYINRGAITAQGGADNAKFMGDALVPPRNRSYSLALPSVPCKDGKTLLAMPVMVGVENWKKFVAWCRQIGAGRDLWTQWDEELKAMSGGGTGRVLIGKVPTGFQDVLNEIGSSYTAEELSVIGQGMGFTWAAFNAPDELLEDEQLRARGFFHELEHPDLDATYTYSGEPYRFSEAGWRMKSRAPLLGEQDTTIRAWLSGLGRAAGG